MWKSAPNGPRATFRQDDLSSSGPECLLGLARFHLSFKYAMRRSECLKALHYFAALHHEPHVF
jgi:hypothetical protein